MSAPITKAFLLGAGLGTRLRPLTEALPKPLIPVFHRPLIHHALDHCLAAGIKEFAINTHHLPESWPATFPDSTYRDAPLSFFHEDVLLETGGGIKNIDPWIGDEVLLVYNGDILTDLPLETLLATHAASGNKATLALRSEGPNCNVAVDGDRVVDLGSLACDATQLGVAGLFAVAKAAVVTGEGSDSAGARAVLTGVALGARR